MLPYWDAFQLITFSDGNIFLFHTIFIPLWLTSDFLWTLCIRDWYFNINYIFWVCMIPLSQFNLSALLRMFIYWSANLMKTFFEALVRISTFDVSLLANLPTISIFSFKYSNKNIPLNWVHKQQYFHDQVHLFHDPL